MLKPRKTKEGEALKGAVPFCPLGKTLPQAKIELSGVRRDGISLTTYTDVEGGFSFNNLPAGTYALKAKKQSKMFPLLYHPLGCKVIEYDGITSASVSLKTE